MPNNISKNKTFLALDVETANEQYASICQIGIVFVENGVITNTWETYIDPETYFTNDWIHGINENTVKGAPLFPEVYGEMINIIGNNLVVTHTTFDVMAINQSLERYNLPPHNIRFIDSAKMARRSDFRFLSSGYGIKNLCENYQIPYVNAHNAIGDATMAAKVVLYLLDNYEPTLEEWEVSLKKKFRNKDTSKIRLDGVEGGPLSGLSFVFTGALARPRKEIAELTASLGGNVRNVVNKDIDYLVIGKPSVYQVKYKKPSTKEQAARDLVAAGEDIKIIDEQEFNSIIEDVETNETKLRVAMKCINTKLVGVTKINEDGRRRQEVIAEDLIKGEEVYLWREPDNPYDNNAIGVYSSEYGDKAGYLSADLAAKLAPLMDNHQLITAEVIEITGGDYDKKTLGVNLKLTIYSPEETIETAKQSAEKYKIQTNAGVANDDGWANVPRQENSFYTSQPIEPNTVSDPVPVFQPQLKPAAKERWRKLPIWLRVLIVLLILVLLFVCSGLFVGILKGIVEIIKS